jgi:hypothetical protein
MLQLLVVSPATRSADVGLRSYLALILQLKSPAGPGRGERAHGVLSRVPEQLRQGEVQGLRARLDRVHRQALLVRRPVAAASKTPTRQTHTRRRATVIVSESRTPRQKGITLGSWL